MGPYFFDTNLTRLPHLLSFASWYDIDSWDSLPEQMMAHTDYMSLTVYFQKYPQIFCLRGGIFAVGHTMKLSKKSEKKKKSKFSTSQNFEKKWVYDLTFKYFATLECGAMTWKGKLSYQFPRHVVSKLFSDPKQVYQRQWNMVQIMCKVINKDVSDNDSWKSGHNC